ncbi:MAG: hypothetical protein AVO35_11260 [Candidatus Aegiribacteria sp. MLS_C]|nr:MAG: hypothetical protein AVO35_11260 [Candidatus Aegiribacteria sp. MLS_C]
MKIIAALPFFLLVYSAPALAVNGDGLEARVELCYATSVNMPETEFGPENVFDGDTATCWATMPGAAPDEGLFFSFVEPKTISTIMVDLVPAGDGYEGIETYQIYVNGLEGGTYSGSDAPVWISTRVKSLFIRINTTDSMQLDVDGIRYTGDLPVGIREVTMTVEVSEAGDLAPLRIVPIGRAAGSVRASSSLEPEEAYSPDFLFDSRPAFGWADGNEEDTGEGENLVFTLDEPVRIEQLRIWNGYQRSETHFLHNERASRISFGTCLENPGVYRLEDSMEPQVVTLDHPLEGDCFELDFLDVYSGEVYRDLVISEFRFFDGENWFILDTGTSEERKFAILEWAEGAEFGRILDRQLYLGAMENGDSWEPHAQTLVLRSNGSFIVWMEDYWVDGEEHMYADGNWQVIDGSTVRIFGRLQRVSRTGMEPYDPYAGSWPDQGQDTQRLTVFSDTLRMSGNTVSSDRGLFQDFSF